MPVFCGDSNIEEEAKWALSNSAPTPTHRHPLSLIPTSTHPKYFPTHPYSPKIMPHPSKIMSHTTPSNQNNVPFTQNNPH